MPIRPIACRLDRREFHKKYVAYQPHIYRHPESLSNSAFLSAVPHSPCLRVVPQTLPLHFSAPERPQGTRPV